MLQALPFKKLGKDPPTQLKPEECCGAAMPLAGEIAAKVSGGGYVVYLQVSCGSPWVHVHDFTIFWVKPLGNSGRGAFFIFQLRSASPFWKWWRATTSRVYRLSLNPSGFQGRTLFFGGSETGTPKKYREKTPVTSGGNFGRTRVLGSFF